jgi:hypothetical protein
VLLTQVDFLLSKGKAKWALPIAQQAVNSAPGEFLTWAKLTQTYIDLGDFGNALLSLNSCPMFTFNERDLHHMPPAARTHLPIKKLIAAADLFNEESSRDIEADAALLRLPAPGLRGTFKKAYRLLTQIVAKIGWDELLKTRSTVFVMEEEYRQHKDKDKESESHKENGNGTTATPTATATEGEADEDASTRGVHSPEGISRPGSVAVPPEDEPAINFNNKRLCERFLGELQAKSRQVIVTDSQTTSSSSSTRICGCTQSGALRLATSRHSTCRTRRRGQNGRFSAS